MLDLLAWLFLSRDLIIGLVFAINAIFVAIVILLENREPGRTLTWLIVLFSFPIIGFILYLFFGHDWHQKRSKKRLRAAYEATRMRRTLLPGTPETEWSAIESDLRRMAVVTTGYPTTMGNRVTVLTDAQVKYPRLIAALKNAKRTIDLEYFLFRYDGIGREIIDVLITCAERGIRVRFMADGYGSLGLGSHAFHRMRAAGIQAAYFAPLITTFSFFKANYRDHRKIALIDDEIVFTGGINIGDEHLGKSKVGPWRDTSVEIRGPVVAQFAALFEEAWTRTTNSPPETHPVPAPAGNESINVIPSGPDTEWFAIREIFFAMINGARRSIAIQSPYFIPDESLLDALVNAALRGVDVKIMVPRRPDTPILRWVAMTYLGEVVRAGGRAYEYTPAFSHQKVIIVDNDVATTGTCNIDIRSFHLDFEVNALFSHPDTIRHLREDFETDLRSAEELTFDDLMNRPLVRRLKESLARLVAPLL